MTHPLKSVRKCDYYRLKKLLDKTSGTPSAELLEACQRSKIEKYKRKNKTIRFNYNDSLPITGRRKEIIRTIQEHQVIILSGETGSGKTTQIPKFCIEAGRGIEGMIGCTQPRRIAALTVADRIAEELGDESLVGSKIRFQENTQRENFIKLMTDGMLLAETQNDPWLNQYDTLIIDEAHERSLNIDFLLGMLKQLIRKRKDLKVIITSATIDTEKFSKAFHDAPIIEVSGRTFPVEVRYRPGINDDLSLAEQSWEAIEEILTESSQGDILVFLPTEQDIRESIETGNKRDYRDLLLLPLYARLSSSEQKLIFRSSSSRKIIFSTNIAETSLTIPGIRFVVDSGFARIARYSPGSGTFGLPVEAVSQSSADQRKGRCGRISEGICIRLYSEEDFMGRALYTQPEILRTNLAEVILRMLSLKISDIEGFPFVDKPSSAGIQDGFKTLVELNAVDKTTKGYRLTSSGREMASIPADPRLSRMLLQSRKEGCLKEAIVLVGALSIQDPREKPKDQPGKAQMAQAEFLHPESDFLTLLNIWKKWESTKGSWTKRLKNISKEHYLSFRKMKEWVDLVQQLQMIAKDRSWKNSSFKGTEEALYYGLHRSIVAGFLSHISRKKDPRSYEASRNRQAYLFPGSVLFKAGSTWVVSAEMVKTSKFYLRINARIEAEWILDLGKHLLKSNYLEPRWDEKTSSVIAREEIRLFQFILSKDKWKPYGPHSPGEAREIFIKQGLIEGLKINAPSFLSRNRKTRDKALQVENKLRKRGYINENAEEEHYREVLPQISSLSELNLYIKKTGDKEFLLKESDFFTAEPDQKELDALPDYLVKGEDKYTISYQFEPGSKADGPTLKIPKEKIHQWSAEDEIPVISGFLCDQIEAYLKGLPKEWRKKLIPIGEHARVIFQEMEIGKDGIEESMTRFIYKKWNLAIPGYLFDTENLPEHIKIKYALVNKKGKVLKHSSRLEQLIEKPDILLDKKSLEEWNRTRGSWVNSWDNLDLPQQEVCKIKGKEITLYPCIKHVSQGIRREWAPTLKESEAFIRSASAELFTAHFQKQIGSISREWKWGELQSYIVHFNDYNEWIPRLWFTLLDSPDIPLCRKGEDFQRTVQNLAPDLDQRGEELWKTLYSAVSAYRLWRDYLRTARSKSHSPQEKYLEDREKEGESFFHQFLQGDFNRNLSDYPRFFRCLKSRTEKGLLSPLKDQERENEWEEYNLLGKEIKDNLSPFASNRKLELLKKYFLTVDEYKFALFCQEEKRKIKVSPKRLLEMIEEIKKTP